MPRRLRIGVLILRIASAGIDYRNTPIELREKLSFDNERLIEIMEIICGRAGIGGCVVVSTCNRTEIYLSYDDSYGIPDAGRLLCMTAGADFDLFKNRFLYRYDSGAVQYLMEVACGLHSAILCEEQISGQINDAAELSRREGFSDSLLNTLFRNAVTAGKRALTEVKIQNVPLSTAYGAVKMAKKLYGTLNNKKCLVIGNGKMGRAAAQYLVSQGCEVTMTLRTYRHGENIIPDGCGSIGYDKRLEQAEKSDFIISATRSPHYTLRTEDAAVMKRKPDYIFDLAVPRDIEPGIYNMIKCYTVDDICADDSAQREQLMKIYAIIDEFKQRFEHWRSYKEASQQMLAAKGGTRA